MHNLVVSWLGVILGWTLAENGGVVRLVYLAGMFVAWRVISVDKDWLN